jgi:cytochrome c oxidase subunit 2
MPVGSIFVLMFLFIQLFWAGNAHAGIWYLPFPDDISTNGHLIDNTIRYIDTVLTIFFAAVVLALIYFIVFYRSRPGHKAVYETGNSKKYILITMCLGLLVFCSIDAVVEHMSFRDLKQAFWNFPQGNNVLKIEVMPQQFAWNFRYAGADGIFATDDDVVAPLGQLHVPVDTPVVLQMSSFDVVHAFYVPQLRLKQDAVPGMVTTFWFQAIKQGKFEIACSALCGSGHYKMRGNLTVETKADFDKWLAEQGAPGSSDDVWADTTSATGGLPDNWGWKWQAKS